MAKIIDVKLVVDDQKQFTDEKTGQTRIYTGYALQVGNAVIAVTPSKRDRALLEYVIRPLLDK